MARVVQVIGLVVFLLGAGGLADHLGPRAWEGVFLLNRVPLLAGYEVFANASVAIAGAAVVVAVDRLRAAAREEEGAGARAAAKAGADAEAAGGGAGAGRRTNGSDGPDGPDGGAREMSPRARSAPNATVVGAPVGERLLMWGGLPLVGGVLGALLNPLAEWALTLPWAPFEGPIRLITSIPDLPATIGGAVVGVVAGLVLAMIGESEAGTVTVTDHEASVTANGRTRTAPRGQVRAVFKDGKRLVLLGARGEEVAGGVVALKPHRLAKAFRAHAYPWRDDGDPHAEDFRRWVPGLPELSVGAHALFAARAKALEKDQSSDAEDLREEINALGIVVRDMNKRQYFRRVADTGE
ncbi:hypothetical protein LG943_12075 [Streptomonospora sp. S1-112]|uniref:Uncharacterized protein n=1 Tax=Streptomonospora mangrovi TaxID=2883123 RepID=A0A9X3NN24_9ACTN|nr:hypothetical protein [Streptomonospora mangrovi]MDA0565051.1 hypothetical protein [Streptomonospora mangrovi]